MCSQIQWKPVNMFQNKYDLEIFNLKLNLKPYPVFSHCFDTHPTLLITTPQ